MDQRISFITLGVENLQAMTDYYKNTFQWTPLKEMDGISFFLLNGCVLGLYSSNDLADDIGIPAQSSGFKRFTLAINFNSTKEVDAAFAELKARGANVVKPPTPVFWGGYSGYIADPEGNYWELAFNPFAELDEKKNVIGHQ